MKQLPENWTENTEENEDSIFLTQEERDIDSEIITLISQIEYFEGDRDEFALDLAEGLVSLLKERIG
tara:strand:+ start:1320 stop:1520 length:201 start_codon:yes stop_codon:yes gene_type:complete